MVDQSNALADALSKTPSVNSLLSQLGDQLSGQFGQSGIFSSLLDDTDQIQSSLASLSQNAAYASTAASSNFSASVSSADSSPNSVLQNLSSLTGSLHTVLNVLRQQQENQNADTTNADDGAAQQSQSAGQADTPQTQDAQTSDASSQTAQNQTSDPSNGGATQQDTTAQSGSFGLVGNKKSVFSGHAASTAVTASTASSASASSKAAAAGSGSDDSQTLAEIVAELLALTQMVVKTLQTTTTGVQANAATGSSDTTQAAQGTDASSGGGDVGQALQKLLAVLQDTATQMSNQLDQSGQGDQSISDMLKSLTAGGLDANKLIADQSLIDQFSAKTKAASLASQGDNFADISASAPTAGSQTAVATGAIAKQLSALDNGLKNVIAAIQQAQVTDPTTVAQAAPTGRSALADTSALAGGAKTATDDWQTRTLSTMGAVQQQQQTVQAPTPAVSGAAAIAAIADKGASAGSDSDSDMLSGGNGNSASFADLGTNSAPASAEGAQAAGTYSFASQLSAFRAANGGSTGLPSVVDQVILQLNRGVKNGSDQVSLQLQPGDLGKITVKLDFGSDGKVQGTVTADNPKTLEMLQKDSRSLERALQDAGLRADPGSLQFSLGGQQNQQNSSQTAANGTNADGDAAAADDNGNLSSQLNLVDPSTLSETYYITPGGVNIRV